MAKPQIIILIIFVVLVLGVVVIFIKGDGEEVIGTTKEVPEVPSNPTFPTTDELYVPDAPQKSNEIHEGLFPAFSDVPIEGTTGETNEIGDAQEETVEETSIFQSLPQPVEKTLEVTVEKVEETATVSKYLDMISLLGSGTQSADATKELITLSANRSNVDNVDVTGWIIRSAVTGRNITIEKSEKLFISGKAGSKEPVVMAPGGKLTILTGRSVLGFSYTVNKCMGYLKQFNTFYPSFSTKCPKPADEILYYSEDPSIFIDNECMNYVERIRVCTVIEGSFPSSISPQCQEAILENIGYNICVYRHVNELDFFSQDQRIYLKQGSELWRNQREVIELIDENGFVVDFVEY